MFDPPIGGGANLFIWIVVILLATGAGITLTNLIITSRKEAEEKEAEEESEKSEKQSA